MILKKPLLTALFVFVLILLLTQLAAYQHYLLYQSTRIKEEANAANLAKEKLETVLTNSITATQTLSFIVKQYGIHNDFDNVGRQILAGSKYVDAVELTDGGEIKYVYPLKENATALGYNILKDSVQNIEAQKAIARGDIFFAGPLRLKQGGTGIVGRLPILVNGSFKGFAISLVKLSTLIKAAGLDNNTGDYIYQLSKINPRTNREEFFLPGTGINAQKDIVFAYVPLGEWKIYVTQKHSPAFAALVPFSILGLLLALMCATTAFTVSRQPVVLKAMVEEKSHLLEASQENYRNMLERISDGMVSLDKDWRYTYLNDTALANHPGGRESVIGKVIWEVHPEMKASQFWHKYHEAMLTNEVVEIEDYYAPMGIWFSVKVYPSEDGLTIFYKDVSATKRIEQEIVRERNLSETAINSLPGVFYMYDRNGRFLRWNKNFETISGYTAGEIKHLHPLDFFDVDEKELLAQRINKVFETGEADVEAMLLKKNGEKIPYYFNGHLARMDGEVYLLGMGIDITERRKAEKALKESEEKYRYLFNNNPAAIIIWDIETFKVLEVNEVAMEQYGYTRAEFLNLTLLDYRPIEDRPTVEKLAQEQLKANIAKTRRTWRHIKKSGEIMYMDVTSHRIEYGGRGAVLSLAKDITEQVIVENQLKETFEDLKRLNTHLQTIREEERATIAREIHDELGQRLTVLKMDASWLIKKINAEAKAERDKLTGMIALIDDTVKIIRRISSDIRPGVLDDLGLVAALEWQSNVFEKQTGIPCKFTSAFTDDAIDKNLASGIFRVYQETLTNVMRHAQATAVTTTLTRDGDDVILCIHDNGQGFNPAVIKSKKTLGLVGMQQRAQMFGGNLTVDSQPGHGTSIILKVPLISTRQKATA